MSILYKDRFIFGDDDYSPGMSFSAVVRRSSFDKLEYDLDIDYIGDSGFCLSAGLNDKIERDAELAKIEKLLNGLSKFYTEFKKICEKEDIEDKEIVNKRAFNL